MIKKQKNESHHLLSYPPTILSFFFFFFKASAPDKGCCSDRTSDYMREYSGEKFGLCECGIFLVKGNLQHEYA